MIDEEVPTDRQLLETIAHTVDSVELGLFAFREEVGERFSRLEGKVDRLEGRVEHIEIRVDAAEKRFDQMDKRFDQTDDRFDTLEEQVGAAIVDHEERLVVLEVQ